MLVEVVFQYRTLVGKCDLGVGLDWDEIEQVTAIESAFEPSSDDRRMKAGRKFRREPVKMTALLRGDRINDLVDVTEIGPGGVVVRRAPFIAHGEHVEVVLEDGDNSYRFGAEGVWMKDDGDDYKVGLVFVGMPVCLHSVVISKTDRAGDVIERISSDRIPTEPVAAVAA
ncbi:MAG TPA: PilZ domain-containing protein [Kofleriaceae bacterium]|nr:PilZ domain-containing protein [Kofleriaceae bacterium]